MDVHLQAIRSLRGGLPLQDPLADSQRLGRLPIPIIEFSQPQRRGDKLLVQPFALWRNPQRAKVLQVLAARNIDRLLVQSDLLRGQRCSPRTGQVCLECLDVVLMVGGRI